MGWASGAGLAKKVWKAVAPYIPPAKVGVVAAELASAFRALDCDTLSEIDGPIGWADEHAQFVRWYRAPRSPKDGDQFIGDGELYQWNGRRWVVVPRCARVDLSDGER